MSYVIRRKIFALCWGGFIYIWVTPKVNGKTRPYNFQNSPPASRRSMLRLYMAPPAPSAPSAPPAPPASLLFLTERQRV